MCSGPAHTQHKPSTGCPSARMPASSLALTADGKRLLCAHGVAGSTTQTGGNTWVSALLQHARRRRATAHAADTATDRVQAPSCPGCKAAPTTSLASPALANRPPPPPPCHNSHQHTKAMALMHPACTRFHSDCAPTTNSPSCPATLTPTGNPRGTRATRWGVSLG